MNTNVDVVVIGGGQAGLAASHALMDTGLSHVVLEAGESTGGSWPHYYESLTLFSPARYCELPDLQMSGDRDRYPTRDETVAYLRRYAEHFELPIRTRSRVVAVRPTAANLWEVELLRGVGRDAEKVVRHLRRGLGSQVPVRPVRSHAEVRS